MHEGVSMCTVHNANSKTHFSHGTAKEKGTQLDDAYARGRGKNRSRGCNVGFHRRYEKARILGGNGDVFFVLLIADCGNTVETRSVLDVKNEIVDYSFWHCVNLSLSLCVGVCVDSYEKGGGGWGFSVSGSVGEIIGGEATVRKHVMS